jgi:hypothetical protein
LYPRPLCHSGWLKMGSHPYRYFVPYPDDFQQALEERREREFAAGRYNPVMMFPPCPVGVRTPPDECLPVTGLCQYNDDLTTKLLSILGLASL